MDRALAPFQAGRLRRARGVAGRPSRPSRQRHDRWGDAETTDRKRQRASLLQGDRLAGNGLAFRRANYETTTPRGSAAARATAQSMRRPAKVGIERVKTTTSDENQNQYQRF